MTQPAPANQHRPRPRPGVEPLEGRLLPSAAVLDLTARGAQGEANSALFRTSDAQPTGSGVIRSFVRLQSNGPAEQGYNTAARPLQFDENKSPVFTRPLRAGDVPVVVVDGVRYREFLLDVNQQASAPLLSLDQLRVYVGDSPALRGYDAATGRLAGLDPVYDLDGAGDVTVTLDYRLNHGSGSGDMVALVPDAAFAGGGYVYLYSRFGDGHANNAGFEEWAVRRGAAEPPPALSSLSGFVYEDANGNGVRDEGEAGIGGVLVELTGIDLEGNVVRLSVTSLSDGLYTFLDLRAGTYSLAEEQPAGYRDGWESLGSLGGAVGDDEFWGIVLGWGQEGTDYNFGEFEGGPGF